MTRSTIRPRATEGRNVHPDACPNCGTTMKPRVGALTARVNAEEVRVDRMPHLSCPKCGEVLLSFEEAGLLQEKSLGLYRRKHRLLSGADIQALRTRLGLSQAGLGRLLKLGPNTVSRWEAGRNVQTAAMDILLRLMRDVPGNVRYLKKHAA